MIVFEDSPLSYLSEVGKGVGYQYGSNEKNLNLKDS